MKFTLTLTQEGHCHPCDVAIALDQVGKELSRDFNGDSTPTEAHHGKVKLSGWLAGLTGEWVYEP